MTKSPEGLKRLLPHGSVGVIAKRLGISSPAVSQALKNGKPSSRVVQEALRMAEASGALAAAQTLATISRTR
jgi:predicted transcriptional regulator